jgi:hypothetical protein
MCAKVFAGEGQLHGKRENNANFHDFGLLPPFPRTAGDSQWPILWFQHQIV